MDATRTVEPLEQAQAWLAAYGGPRVCAAELLCDRHRAEQVALVHEDAAGHDDRLTFGQLRERSARFAGVLRALGVGRGDRVATLLPKTPELAVTTLALWRLGAVHVPLFTAFGPQAVAHRLDDSAATVVVTDPANRAKVDDAPGRRVVAVEGPDGPSGRAGDTPFRAALDRAEPVEEPTWLTGDDVLVLIYTSGTTGQPKGVAVPVKALASFEAYMRFGLDVRPEDVYWNMGDPGWAYGLFYALIGPLLLGRATLLVNAPFSAEATYRALAKHAVTNVTAAPTVYRALRAAGAPAAASPRLRVASSIGEPLNPDVVAWAERQLGVPIHDQYGQTEQGMFVGNHHAPALARPLRPGSMGHPMPGFRPVILDAAGRELGPGEEGQLALDRRGSPLYWFRGYYHDAERTAERFTADGRYYLTGDAATRDDDGYFFFAARTDDVINSAGGRIGPFEVESALIAHRTVAEAAAVGKPDALRGEIVKAYVVLKPGYVGSDELAAELGQFVKSNLSAHAYPREIEFVDQLPKTVSGKIQRNVLRARARDASAAVVRG